MGSSIHRTKAGMRSGGFWRGMHGARQTALSAIWDFWWELRQLTVWVHRVSVGWERRLRSIRCATLVRGMSVIRRRVRRAPWLLVDCWSTGRTMRSVQRLYAMHWRRRARTGKKDFLLVVDRDDVGVQEAPIMATNSWLPRIHGG